MLLCMSLEYDVGPENEVYFHRAVESRKLMPSENHFSFIRLPTNFDFYPCKDQSESVSYVKREIVDQMMARIYSLQLRKEQKKKYCNYLNFWFTEPTSALIQELNKVAAGQDINIETSDEYRTVIMTDDQPLLTNNGVLINYRKDCHDISRFVTALQKAFSVLKENDSTVVDIGGYQVYKRNGITEIST